jgi:hypothetical protein
VYPKVPIWNHLGLPPSLGMTGLERGIELAGVIGQVFMPGYPKDAAAGQTCVCSRTCPHACPRVKRGGYYAFNWTDEEAWEVPEQWDDIEVPCNWTVTLDTTSKILATLTIRGTVRFWNTPVEPLTLHAHIINILGGKLVVGEDRHGLPEAFRGPMATVMLHGDVYNWGKLCPNCGKKIFVAGELILRGQVPIIHLQ